MPIGGVTAGHVYLSGEGNLTDFLLNEYPVILRQGFALRTVVGDKTDTRLLNQMSFPDMTFRGEYPIAKLDYTNSDVPVQAGVEVFSPFIPLNADESSKPATIFNF